MTDDEVLQLWANQGWQPLAQDALIEIATSARASHSQRYTALGILNEAMSKDLLDPGFRYPAFAIAVMKSIISDASKAVGFRARRAQRRFEAQLNGLAYLLRTVQQFTPSNVVVHSKPNASALDKLLS